ncbi:aminoglycoside phosphotransferase family protein [Actinopolymorpha pittospori]|uniref:Aminoglycoside phosphotransferase (APT) family kinase protein n=1 Tax=Actinopolymorpha pittospori TaxID=648752 RepID=A0A927MRP9_9ACTN|nr:aminoglycoside phosphotransferase family protein [Actinopolymorpha pittospori]MBE1605032.1 aminoglycoside phosphotransferase (APT) family kinase protein [Actinopolymorpha pittospori]
MSAGKMHADEIDLDVDLVRGLLTDQFPHWADLPIRPFASSGTVNALFRLGDDLAVRLPRVEWGIEDVAKDHVWLPRLAPLLPVPIPTLLGQGTPGPDYPWPWSVYRWLEGENPLEDSLEDPRSLAADLAGFVAAFRAVDLPDGPPAYRGGPLSAMDAPARSAIKDLHGMIDTDAATAAWDEALRVPDWSGPPVWVHADLLPGNLLVDRGRLSAVIDFATTGVGDPACDLIVAWSVLPASVRDDFREALAADDAAWARGRGRALAIALIQLPYYQHTNPVMAANARHVIREVLADHARTGGQRSGTD